MSAAAAIFYGVCSGSMAFVNKLAMNTYGFRYPEVIMLAQMTVTVAALRLAALTGRLSLPPYSAANARRCLLPSLFYVLNSTFSLSALSGMNIPMYNVLKRTGPVFYIFLAACILKKGWPSPAIVASVLTITGGCVIAGFGDLSFEPKAYLYGISSIFLQGIYLTLVERLGLGDELSTNGILYVNSANCLPFLVVFVLLTSEFAECAAFLARAEADFYAIIALVVVAGCVLNYSQFLCTTMNSALTTSVIGVLKSGVTTVIGIFAFGGVSLTAPMVLGIAMNLGGAASYTALKYHEKLVGTLKKVRSGVPLSELTGRFSAKSPNNNVSSNGHLKSNGSAAHGNEV